jgi:5-methylcytosine-specific restriction protein B
VEGLRPNINANGFERRDGIFKAFCSKAANDTNENNKYVIIIDEINRGEISKVFGELFFSIDPGYRGTKGKVDTQYQNLIKKDEKMPDDSSKKYPFIKGFYIPENVFIIGTMNDIDRSVESMDFAFRRRFAFKEIKAKDSKAMLWDGDNYQVLEDVMDRVNNELIKPQYGLSEAYQIGASYFNKIKKNENSNNIDYKKELKALWEFHIKGLVFEYLRGKPNTMDLLKQLESAYFGKDINTEEGQEEGEKAENVNDTKG